MVFYLQLSVWLHVSVFHSPLQIFQKCSAARSLAAHPDATCIFTVFVVPFLIIWKAITDHFSSFGVNKSQSDNSCAPYLKLKENILIFTK